MNKVLPNFVRQIAFMFAQGVVFKRQNISGLEMKEQKRLTVDESNSARGQDLGSLEGLGHLGLALPSRPVDTYFASEIFRQTFLIYPVSVALRMKVHGLR